jgi:hypothetical protein
MGHKGKKLLLFFASISLMVLCPVFLTGCKPLDESDVVNSLLPNVWVFLSHLFATVVLLTLTI